MAAAGSQEAKAGRLETEVCLHRTMLASFVGEASSGEGDSVLWTARTTC